MLSQHKVMCTCLQTGQITCHDTRGRIIDCTGSGQDAELKYSAHSPALPHGHPFMDVREGYWSSTTSMFEPDWAWALYLTKGAVGVGQKNGAHFSVWAVCDLPSRE